MHNIDTSDKFVLKQKCKRKEKICSIEETDL